MKTKGFLGVIFLMVVAMTSFSQTYHTPKSAEISNFLQNQNCEVQVQFFVDSKDQVNYFSRKYSVDHVKMVSEDSFQVRAYLNHTDLQKFLNEQIQYQIKDAESVSKVFSMATTKAQMVNWDRYPTYSVYTQLMAQFQTNYPTFCKIDTILSNTPGGKQILVAKISKNVNIHEDEPEFLYSSTMHGDETTGAIFMLRLIDYLLSNYATLPRVANLLDNMEIYICPFANPDGTYKASNNSIGNSPTSTRTNFNNVDLNRNYPDPWTGNNPDGNTTQPETQAFMNFATAHNFVMSANFHGGAELANYPWDYYTTTERIQPDAAWWISVCKEYADSCKIAASNNGYFTEQAYTGAYPGVTEGGDWYAVTGGRQDYMGYFQHCRELTLEVSSTKALGTENLNTYWNYNFKSLMQFMEQALYGIRGVVIDSITELPIKAKVLIESHDADNTEVYTSLPVGNYHRPIKGGTYSVTYSAPCYQSQTHIITVADKQSVRKNIKLVPGLRAEFVVANTITCNSTIEFNNTTDSTATGNTWKWDFGDGTFSTQNSPTHTYATEGIYSVTLMAGNSCSQKDTAVKINYIKIQYPEVPFVTNASNCTSGPVTLTATASGNVRWYNQLIGGNLLATGNTYTTPSVTATQTYYVENLEIADSITGGDNRVNSGGGFYNNTSEYGLYFDALKPFKLMSVMVNANSSASRTFKLYNSSGSVIQQKTITLSEGQTRVFLDFDISQGAGYKLTANTNPNLYRNNTTASYPYLIGDLVKITASNAASNPSSVYYFFYDWHVQEVGCLSARVPITASIGSGAMPGNAGLITGATTVCDNQTNVIYSVPAIAEATSYQWTLPAGYTGLSSTNSISVSFVALATSGTIIVNGVNGCGSGVASSLNITVNDAPIAIFTHNITEMSVAFTNNSLYATNGYSWNFDDGNTSVESNPTHNYAQNGNYHVSLVASNQCGTDSVNVLVPISVVSIAEQTNNSSVIVYPSPARDVLYVKIESSIQSNQNYNLYNNVGQVVLQGIIPQHQGENIVEINIGNLSVGYYFIKLSILDKPIKVIKI